jgi:N-acylneuraminate cytidylyltransferase|tara:strand:- start:200 stop:892 length:693 start_codon:yes stop_codon:yes gene_type:complete
MKTLVVIPARGGSKGIPHKNVKKLNGKPLIIYTIEAARKVFDDDNILVSTDDQEIKSIVEGTGLEVPFLRPPHLATDTATTYDVLIHALEYKISQGFNPDIILLLQPTSPFRTSQHIEEALKLYNNSLDMVVSVKLTNSNPYYILFEENKEGYLKKVKNKNFTRRQDVPNVYEYNGALYVINVSSLKQKEIVLFDKVIKYEMNEYNSHDIDTQLDWFIAEKIMENYLNEK